MCQGGWGQIRQDPGFFSSGEEPSSWTLFKRRSGTSLVVQWLRRHSHCGGHKELRSHTQKKTNNNNKKPRKKEAMERRPREVRCIVGTDLTNWRKDQTMNE